MELLRTFLLFSFYIIRINCSLARNGCPYPTHPLQQFHEHYILPDATSNSDSYRTVQYGHHAFYSNFVTSYLSVSKCQSIASVVNIRRKNWFPELSILLCGDVHPCPGPVPVNPSVTSTDYNMFNKRGLHFIHINTRSLLPKIENIRILARKTRAACIAISESWLDSTVFDSEIHIDNYNILRKDRERRGGGVCLYIRDDLAFNPRPDLLHNELEATWCELLLPKSKPILCGVIYRPPKQSQFYQLLESVCSSSIHFSSMETVILGDFNTDVSKSNKRCTLLSSLKNFMNMFHFSQLICDFTRIDSLSSTVIDLILVSDKSNISQSGVLDLCLSDHLVTYCTRKVSKSFFGSHNTVKMRTLKRYNKDDFQKSLLDTDWSSVLLCDNVSDAWDSFKSLFLAAVNNIAPVKEVRIKQRTEPWITSEILESINERDRAFHLFKRDKSDDNFMKFKLIRNKTQDMIYQAKQSYFNDQLVEHQSDSKSLWNVLKKLGLPSKKSPGSNSSNIDLKFDGSDEICFDRPKVSESFNSFYTTVASKLVDKLPKSLNRFGRNFVFRFYSEKGVLPNSFSFSVVSENKILVYLNKLSIKKATGLDGIPCRFVRDGASIIASPLAHIVNLSLIQGSVPDDLKTARVVPLFKKNDKTDVGNYRPVSILSIISKIFEKVVYDQVESYLRDNNLLYNFQSGFRRGFSTDTCLIHLSDYMKFEMDKGHLVGMVMLDLQKAFDTVNHSILLMKLEGLGLGTDILRWFQSYLSGRKQLVDIAGTFSDPRTITCGVPQGSILGPLLFLIYVNDMAAVVKNKLLLYADDSAILVSDKNRSNIEAELSSDLELVSQWLVDNKLSLHLGKTEAILFGSKARMSSNRDLNVTCKGQSINSTTSVKYLGAVLDQCLSGDTMASSVISKANARLKFLYRKKAYLTYHTKRLLVLALIQCHFDYACSFWYHGLTKFWKDKLQVTQNKLVRFVLDLDHRAHLEQSHFVSLNWLPVSKRCEQITLCHVFKAKNGLSPSYMSDFINTQDSVHNYNTRLSSNGGLALPKVKSFGLKSFSYIGCKLWNMLPSNIREHSTISGFKQAVKLHFLTS